MYVELDSCYFSMNNQETHPDYISTGFYANEYDSLDLEGIIFDLENTVHEYNDNDLRRNNYYMYYKNYAVWLSHCQRVYPTTEISDTGKDLSKIASLLLAVLILSSILTALDIGFPLLYRKYCKGQSHRKGLKLFLLLSSRTLIFLAILVLLVFTH